MGKDDSLKKAFEMAILFQETKFNKIQQGLRMLENDPNDTNGTAEAKIRGAVQDAQLGTEAEDWLWNYLKHYNISKNFTADTGW
jgi:hypothetical protein